MVSTWGRCTHVKRDVTTDHFYLAGCPWWQVSCVSSLLVPLGIAFILKEAVIVNPQGRCSCFLIQSLATSRGHCHVQSWDCLPRYLLVVLWPPSEWGTFPVLAQLDPCPAALWGHLPRSCPTPAFPVACCQGSSSNGLSDSSAVRTWLTLSA